MSTSIILVSHALTEWNIKKKIQGHRDVPLNSTGRKMARLLADRLREVEISAIYSSDLSRAWQTAEPIAVLKELSIVQDSRLREGRSISQETIGEYPVLAFNKEWEIEEEVLERMREVLSEIATMEIGRKVLVISHAKAIELFIRDVLINSNLDPGLYLDKRSALNILNYSSGSWKAERLNDDNYLLIDGLY